MDVGFGLVNSEDQHTCYVNALLQLLWNCGLFRAGVLALPGDQVNLNFSL